MGILHFIHIHTSKKEIPHTGDVTISNLVIVLWHNWYKPLWDFLIYFETLFSSTDHKLTTFEAIYENSTSWKVVNYKDHARGNYNVCPPHMPIINPFDRCIVVPCPVKLVRVIQPYWSLHHVQVNLARVIQLQHVWQCFCQIIPAWYSKFATFQTPLFFINGCQTWTIYDLWRKMRYQYVDMRKFHKGLC